MSGLVFAGVSLKLFWDVSVQERFAMEAVLLSSHPFVVYPYTAGDSSNNALKKKKKKE